MQLGARWKAGEPPHRSVPQALHQAIARLETEHPTGESWTLTWLEGRPRCALDDLALLTINGAGQVSLEPLSFDATGLQQDDDDDDWLN